MKKFFALFLILGVFFASCTTQSPPPAAQQPPAPEEKGTLSLSISSQESYNEDSDVSQIMVDFESIKAIASDGHEPGLTVNEKIYNLLELEGEKDGLGSTELEQETFTGLKVTVSKIQLLLGNGETVQVELPQKEFSVENNFRVTKDSETNIVLYFDLYSIAMQDGKYVFTPGMVKLFGETQFGEFMKAMEEEEEKVEGELEKPRLEQFVFPSSGTSGENAELKWKIASNLDLEVAHTAVHWDLTGGHGENFEEYANASEILTDRTNEEFTTGIQLPQVEETSTLFFRVHAVVNVPIGEVTPAFEELHLYSGEESIIITGQEETQEFKEFVVMADDSKFDPNEITVSPGDMVRITFNVPTSGVSWGGLDMRSDYFNTGTIKPGQSKAVEFTAPASSFKVRSYWPSSSVLKATMDVTVE
ncbi:MAG: DUF4382 domain-containing protein [Candidatus Diapherotrites archaeon]|nr:DUF4382 domain-containing protein [Candidatus Diapherotrites archaeon]